MTPGLANEPPFPERAVKGAVVAVSSLDRETVPLFVGICEIDVSTLGEVQGTKGHAVRGIQWEGDELWAWSPSSRPGVSAPKYIQEWDEEETSEEADVGEVAEGVQELALEEGQEAGELQTGEPAEEEAIEEPVVEEKEPATKGTPFALR
jgi:translation initiation factor 2D